MSWVNITEAKFLEQCTGAEVTAIKTAALATAQTEPLTNTIAKVVKEVRGRVAANPQNKLHETESFIPEELEGATIAIIRFRALNRLLAGKSLLTDGRMTEYKDARADLAAVAKGEIAIEQPATESDQVITGPGVEIVSSTTRNATRAKLSGL